MNTKIVVITATLLVAFQPAYGMLDKFKEDPVKALTAIAAAAGCAATAYQEYRKFSKTPEAKQQKYEPLIIAALDSFGIATTESQAALVKTSDLQEILQKYMTVEQVNQALNDLDAKRVDTHNALIQEINTVVSKVDNLFDQSYTKSDVAKKIADLRTELAAEIGDNVTNIAALSTQVSALISNPGTPPTTPEEE